MPVEPGHNLLHYRLIEKIGEGGMGVVWKAIDTQLDREVALKILPSRVSDDPAALARFQREARAVAALSHPNILAIHNFGSDAGVAFVVMELMEGESLRQRVAEGPLPRWGRTFRTMGRGFCSTSSPSASNLTTPWHYGGSTGPPRCASRPGLRTAFLQTVAGLCRTDRLLSTYYLLERVRTEDSLSTDSKSTTPTSFPGRDDLLVYSISQDELRPWATTPFQEWSPAPSPDGRFAAYASDETGRPEVWVQTFPEPEERWRVSVDGGQWPTWREDGNELYYFGEDGHLVAVAVNWSDASAPRFGTPQRLFFVDMKAHTDRPYDTIDGEQFLVNRSTRAGTNDPIRLVQNWASPR